MNRLTLFILQISLVAVTTLTASHWKAGSQTAGAAQAQTASAGNVVSETQADITTRPGLAANAPGAAPTANAGIVGEAENTLGADQANKTSNTGVAVSGTQAAIIASPGLAAGIAANAGGALIDLEGADPQSERDFSFDTEKDPAAASGP